MRERERAREEAERRDAPDRPEAPGPTADVLALQRSAGNQAVGALLARAPDTKPKEAPAASGTRATVPGVGTIPLESVSWPGGRSPGHGGRDNEAMPQEIAVTSLHGDHSPALHRAALDGKAVDVDIVMVSQGATITIKLKGAVISSYSTGAGNPPIESWTLNFTGIKFERSPEEKGEGAPGGGPGAQWDYGER